MVALAGVGSYDSEWLVRAGGIFDSHRPLDFPAFVERNLTLRTLSRPRLSTAVSWENDVGILKTETAC
jgi:hypothetical protein